MASASTSVHPEEDEEEQEQYEEEEEKEEEEEEEEEEEDDDDDDGEEEDEEDEDEIFYQQGVEVDTGVMLDPRCVKSVSDLLACVEPRGSYDKIVQYLEANCGIEADESRAWAFYYMGSAKALNYVSLSEGKEVWLSEEKEEAAMEVIHHFEQSLAQGKSSRLRYLASWKLGEFYDLRNRLLRGIRCYRIQLQEAEDTGWKHAKVCALFKLCIDLFECGEFEEAIRLARELEMLGRHDLFTNGLSLCCQGHFDWVLSNFKECVQAHNYAYDIFLYCKKEICRQNYTPKVSGIMLKLLYPTAFEAKYQLEQANKGEGVYGKVEVGAKILSLLALWFDEDDRFYQGIICHQYAIARKDLELVIAADNVVLIRWRECKPTPSPIMDEQKSEILERIMRYLTDKCRIEEEESRAWAFYYAGEILTFELQECNIQQTFEVATPIDMYEQSLLHGRSSTLRYVASRKLAFLSSTSVERIRYYSIQLKEAEATTWKGSNPKVYALCHLSQILCDDSQFEEAIRFQEQLSKVEPDDPFEVAEGLSLYCEALIADAMGNDEKCLQACHEAISLLDVNEFREIRDDIISDLWSPMSIAQAFSASAIAGARSLLVRADSTEHEERRLRSRRDEITELLGSDPAWKELMEKKTYSLLRTEGEMHLENKKFDEAEAVASKLLDFSKYTEDAGMRAEALMFKAKVGAKCCPQNLDVIDLCFEARKLVAEDPANRLFQRLVVMEAEVYFTMNIYKVAIEKYKVCIGTFMDIQQTMDCSEWRIYYLETMKLCFSRMQISILFANIEYDHLEVLEVPGRNVTSKSFMLKGNEVKHALIWAERERARDLLYSLQKKSWEGHAYLNNLSVFDKDDIKAWTELEDICSLVEQDTVFLVFSVTTISSICTYFLHVGEEPEVNVTIFENYDFLALVLEARKFILDEDTESWKGYMFDLFRICINPFKQRLEDGKIKKIIIVPNGGMSLIPFAALMDHEDKDQPFLIQKYEISIISSLRMFKYCERRREHLTKVSEKQSALVVGDPTKDLPHARAEAQIVANILKDVGMNTNLLMKEQATAQAVSGFLPTSFWIHMACHATIEKDIPYGALKLSRNVALDISCKDVALVLASNEPSSDYRNTKSVVAGGLLTAEEIASEGEIRAVATILSACSSGLGRECAEGTLGLTRSLHLAGVPTVVASTWDVEDSATTEFMKTFYTNIRDGCQLSTALRTSMVSMIENYEPLYWASFFISGSPSLKLPHI